MNRNTENEAIARLRMESLMSSNNEMQLEHYETLYNDEKLKNAELRSHLSDQDSQTASHHDGRVFRFQRYPPLSHRDLGESGQDRRDKSTGHEH